MKIIDLRQPMFHPESLFPKWTVGVWGFGVDMNIINYAIKNKEKFKVKYKDESYEITGTNAMKQIEKYNSYHMAQTTRLGVIPKNKFTKLFKSLEGKTVETIPIKGTNYTNTVIIE